MSFSNESGYTPSSISELMNLVMAGVNSTFGTDYGTETFLGTNLYKLYYALIQRLQENEVKTSEIVAKLQDYFRATNERISRPNTTNPGLIDYLAAAGYRASVKPPADVDAGKVFVCVDTDETAEDYAATKLNICNIIKRSTVAGVVSQGTEVEAITLSNSQEFDFKFNLPTRTPIKLRLTTVLSQNNQFTVLSVDTVKEILFENITARYRLGLNFEPQRYFSILNAPWAASTLLEYSLDDGATWSGAIYGTEYDELLTFEIVDISVVES